MILLFLKSIKDYILKYFFVFFLFFPGLILAQADFKKAEQFFQKGKYAEAKTSFEAALKQKQTDKLIYEHLGDASFKIGKISEAVEYWKKAKEMGATNKVLDKKIEKKEYYEPIY